jgi:poly-gamma-glutamate capsule biosynthesis protein CapA/YwtB (metallophosphatase superfamily)
MSLSLRSLVLAAPVLLLACAPRGAATPPPAVAPEPAATAAAPEPTPLPPAVAEDDVRCRERVEAGRTVLRAGNALEAASLFEAALTDAPHCLDASWELGWARQATGEFDRALDAWDHLKTLAPDYPELARHYPVLVMRRDQARLLAALPATGTLAAREETPRPGPTLSITAVGDVQLGRAWPEDKADLPPDGPRTLFASVKDVLAQGDLTFGNLETALADTGASYKCGKASKACFAFRAPAGYAKQLAEARFAVVSTANNHAGDFGLEGRESTRLALDAAGVAHSGVVGDIASLERQGLRIALIGFAFGSDMHRLQDLETARRLVADARRRHDLVLVSVHAGAEGVAATHVTKTRELFMGEDRGDVYAFAHAVIDAGADLVLGHGPHVLRAMELYKGRLIAYSLGNFSAWHSFSLVGALAVSGILQVTLAPNGVLLAARLVPTTLQGAGVPTPDPEGRAIKAVRELSQADFGAPFLNEQGRWERTAPTAAASPDGVNVVKARRAARAPATTAGARP